MTKTEIIGLVSSIVLASGLILFGGIKLIEWITPDEYDPLRTLDLVLESSEISPGESLSIRNGVCTTKEETVSTESRIWIQESPSDNIDPLVADSVHDLFGTDDQPRAITIYPGCVGTQFFELPIPNDVTPGTYMLHIRVRAFNEFGNERIYELISKEFKVTDANSNR